MPVSLRASGPALAGGQLIASLLYDVSPRDPAAFVRLVRLLHHVQPAVVHTFLIVAGL